MAQSKTYARPPITEAVIEVAFTSALNKKDLVKLSKKYQSHYPKEDSVSNFEVEVNVRGVELDETTAKLKNQRLGHRRSSEDMCQLLVLWPKTLTIAQLAPYDGWATFYQRFNRDWRTLKSTVAQREIERIGIRYINRIDIPVSSPVIEHEEFLNIFPKLPDMLQPMNAFNIQAQVYLQDIDCQLRINSAAVPSPLIDHASFVVDLDFLRVQNVPQNDRALQNLLNTIRNKKNEVFESLITDKARALFNHGD